MDPTVFKPGGGGTEDEVGGSFNITVVEIEPGIFTSRVNSILVSQEPAVDQHNTVPLCMQRHRLCHHGCIVLDGEVLKRDITASDLQGVGLEGAHLIDQRMVVVGDDGLLPVFSGDGQITEIIGDDDLFVVDTLLDEDGGGEIGIKSSY